MRRLLLAFALLLVPTQALALVGAVASHRSGHQMSPTWAFPTACLVVRSSAGTYTAYVPSADTDLARGDKYIAYEAAEAAGDQVFLKAATYDISNLTAPLTFAQAGVSFYGMGMGTSGTVIYKGDAGDFEGTTMSSTGHVVRNMRFTHHTTSTGEAFLVKGSGAQDASLAYCYVENFYNNESDCTATLTDCEILGVVTNVGIFRATRTTVTAVSTGALATSHCITQNVGATEISITDCTLTCPGGSNASCVLSSITTAGTFTFTNCTMTLQAGTGNCVSIAGAVGTKTANLYNCTLTAPAAGFGVRNGSSVATTKMWNGSITGPDGTTGKSLIQTAGTLSYNSATQNGYAATTGSPSLSTSGTVGTSN